MCAPNLEILDIRHCENLIEIHEAIGSLDKLKSWNLMGCKKLQTLCSSFRLKSLESISLHSCVSLEKLPDLCAPNLQSLELDYCENLVEVHEAIGSLDKLKSWRLMGCKKLRTLCSSFRLKSLESICLHSCVSLEKLPDLCAPNLESLELNYCENLIEVHEAIGSLDKLRWFSLTDCKKLQILPSTLRLKSLESLYLDGCVSLEKFPKIHPGKKLENLSVYNTNIREWPLSPGYLISGLGKFTNLEMLDVRYVDGNIIESHILTKPDSFPSLRELRIDGSNIVTIPRSIIRFTTLQTLWMSHCENLREIPRLPESIGLVDASDCMSLDLPSSRRLLNQVSSLPLSLYMQV